MDDDTILSETDINSYLVKDFLPFVLSMYTTTVKAHTSFEEFFRLLVKAIIKLGLKKDKVYEFLLYVQFTACIRTIFFFINFNVQIVGQLIFYCWTQNTISTW